MVTRIVIVGLTNNWTGQSHLPALKALGEKYSIVGVLNTSKQSSQRAIDSYDLGPSAVAYSSPEEVAAAQDVDLVLVSIRVPFHYQVAKPLVDAGKDVFIEWPLGNGLKEAQDLYRAALKSGSRTIVGLQARKSPVILKAKSMIESGELGDIVQTTIHGHAPPGGKVWLAEHVPDYLMHRENGANLVTIALGQASDALFYMMGHFKYLSSTVYSKFPEVEYRGRDGSSKTVTKTSPDQLMVQGQLETGAAASIHIRGGMPSKASGGLRWEILGTKGDLVIEGPLAYVANQQLTLAYLSHEDTEAGVEDITPESGKSDHVAIDSVKSLWEAFANDPIGHDGRQGKKVTGYPTIQDSGDVHEFIEAVWRSEETGSRVTYPHP